MTPSELSRLLNHRLDSPSIYDIEAVARVINVSMEALYAERRDQTNEVAAARAAITALSRFVDAIDVTVIRKAPMEKGRPANRARVIMAATPNVELYGGDGPREDVPNELWSRGARHAARVIGNSMIDAGINSGDIVFFRPPTSIAAARGKIVVCRYGSGVYLKRLERVGDEIRLLSDNEAYKPLIVAPDDDFELYGIVVLPPK